MEFLKGETLVKKDQETISADEALAEKEIIGFYFSAHWCPPCREFTPILRDFYGELIEGEKPFEIIFVSSDDTSEDMFTYMTEMHGDWLAVPHGADLKEKLSDKFGIKERGIPTLVIVKKDGTVINKEADAEVETKGAKLYEEWVQ